MCLDTDRLSTSRRPQVCHSGSFRGHQIGSSQRYQSSGSWQGNHSSWQGTPVASLLQSACSILKHRLVDCGVFCVAWRVRSRRMQATLTIWGKVPAKCSSGKEQGFNQRKATAARYIKFSIWIYIIFGDSAWLRVTQLSIGTCALWTRIYQNHNESKPLIFAIAVVPVCVAPGEVALAKKTRSCGEKHWRTFFPIFRPSQCHQTSYPQVGRDWSFRRHQKSKIVLHNFLTGAWTAGHSRATRRRESVYWPVVSVPCLLVELHSRI